jgi:hypothetical protein
MVGYTTRDIWNFSPSVFRVKRGVEKYFGVGKRKTSFSLVFNYGKPLRVFPRCRHSKEDEQAHLLCSFLTVVGPRGFEPLTSTTSM